MDIVAGNLVSYKPLLEGTLDDERHMVKVVETHLSEMVCEDVFGNQFRLSYGRVDEVTEGADIFNALQEANA